VMKIYLLFYMCHFAMGLTHCYKTTVFLHLLIVVVSFAQLQYFTLSHCDFAFCSVLAKKLLLMYVDLGAFAFWTLICRA